MHFEYKVRLPDYTFIVAPRHTLIPSAYGVCEVRQNGDLSVSGDTFNRVRSGKHDSSSAYTHADDMRELFKCNLIQSKPILLLSTDGASDEAPRFPKPLAAAAYFFKNLKLDVLLHGVNDAGLSAFNAVERRMSPLSHDIAGVIHDACMMHMDYTWMQTARQWIQTLRKKTFSRRRKFWPKFGQTQRSTDMQLIVKQCVSTRSLFQLKSRPCGYLGTSNNAGMLSKWSNALMMNAVNRLKQIGCQCSLTGLCHFLLCTNTE